MELTYTLSNEMYYSDFITAFIVDHFVIKYTSKDLIFPLYESFKMISE